MHRAVRSGQGAVRARTKRRGEEGREGKERGKERGKGEGPEKRAGVAKIDGGVQGGRSPPAIFSDMS